MLCYGNELGFGSEMVGGSVGFGEVWFLPPGTLRFSVGIVFSCVCMLLLVFFVSLILQFFTRNILDTPTKLSGMICRPPEQIKFDYHDSNSLPVALRMG